MRYRFYLGFFDRLGFGEHAQVLSTSILVQLENFIGLIQEGLVVIRIQLILLDELV